MSSKKWVIALISVTLIAITLFGAVQYYLDPLLQYGGERGPLTFRKYDEFYCNPGIAKNYDYNAVLLGPSTAQNTDINRLNSLFNCNTIKLTYVGSSVYNSRKILDMCYDTGNQIDKVFWVLDENVLTRNPNSSRYPLPEYLYDKSVVNDVSYLLNLDIFYYYTLPDIKQTINHNFDTMMMEGNWGDDESIYCRENVLSSVGHPKRQHEKKAKTYYEDIVLENLEYNVLPIIKEHPDTEFNIIMAPYSILFWYLAKSDGTLDARLYSDRTALSKIMKYDNVKVHFFHDDREVITNLDLYKDYTHYKPEINSWMSEEMSKGSHLLTLSNYNQVLDDFYQYIMSFDYDSLYSEQSN